MAASLVRLLPLALATFSCASESPRLAQGETSASSQHRAPARPALVEDATGDHDDDDGAATVGIAGATSDSPATGSAGAAAGAGPIAPRDCEPHQPVLEEVVRNARDLGGTPLAAGAAVSCGALYRGQPLRLTEDGCADTAELGVRTVLDLRTESERLSAPDAACVDARLVFAPFPVPYGLSAADYLNVLHETPSLATAFHTFGDPTAYPIYFHCTLGRDRTGIVSALLLLTLGATRDTVMQEYLLSQPNVGASPDSLDAVLDEVEARGGVENVLRDAGITEAELAVMRAHATAE